MLGLDDALAVLLNGAGQIVDCEDVPLAAASGRVLASDLYSDIMVPSADNSAMDGYAFRFSDFASGQKLRVAQRIPAGLCGVSLGIGEAARIFTGAPIPEGADTVVRQEWCSVENGNLFFNHEVVQGDSVRHMGDDIRAGDLVLKAGTRLDARHLGLVASIGKTEISVVLRPRVALLVTGSELVQQGESLPAGKIYNSNQTMLRTLLREFGCTVTEYGIVPDDFQVTREKLMHAAQNHDCVVTSGGVSVGDEDHIKPVIQQDGQIHFWRVAVKPGKPVVYGELFLPDQKATPIIGLPGNPVSAYVTFLLFVRPYLLKMQGVDAGLPKCLAVRSADDYVGDKERREFLRARLNDRNEVTFFKTQSSGVLSSLAWGDGIVENPAAHSIEKGSIVKFYPFGSFFHS